MASLDIDSNEFADIVCCFLVDKLNNMDSVIPESWGNDNFNDISTIMSNRGLRTPLLQYYLSVDPQTRIKYNNIKHVFNSDINRDTPILIRVRKNKKISIEPAKRTLLKKIINMGIRILTGNVKEKGEK